MALELAASTHSMSVERVTGSGRCRSIGKTSELSWERMPTLVIGRWRMAGTAGRDREEVVDDSLVVAVEG